MRRTLILLSALTVAATGCAIGSDEATRAAPPQTTTSMKSGRLGIRGTIREAAVPQIRHENCDDETER